MGSIVERRGKSGKVTYQAHVMRKGHPRRVKTFSNKTKAARWITRIEAAIEERRDLPHREALRRTVADEVERYAEDEGFAKLSAGEQVKRAKQLRRWADLLGQITVAELTPAAIKAARQKLKTEGGKGRPVSSSTLNRYMAALSKFCSWLVGEGLLQENPARAVKVERGPERERVFVLTPDERSRLLEACAEDDPRLYALVVLALTTGGRQEELCGLKWSEVNIAERRVYFLKTKNGEARSLPLPDAAINVLKGLSKVRHLDGTVFGPDPFPEQPWRRVRRIAKLDSLPAERVWKDGAKDDPPDQLRFHDLRHCYGTALALAGATLTELKKALGHKTLAMVMRYAHLTERDTEDSIRQKLAGVELA